RKALEHLLSHGPLAHPGKKAPHHLEIDVSLKKRQPHLSQGLIDVLLAQLPAPLELLEYGLQPLGKALEHRSHPSDLGFQARRFHLGEEGASAREPLYGAGGPFHRSQLRDGRIQPRHRLAQRRVLSLETLHQAEFALQLLQSLARALENIVDRLAAYAVLRGDLAQRE